MLFFSDQQIVLQEVPDEISLALSISGCPLNCKNCHSKETHNIYYGKELAITRLSELIKNNKYISCVLFYGGDWMLDDLSLFLKFINRHKLKTALYTGREFNYFDTDFLKLLDYIKVGRYIEKFGDLKSENTNQKMYKLLKGSIDKQVIF